MTETLSANNDFNTMNNFSMATEYYDWDSEFNDTEIWAENALNQSIEMVLTTEPHERLFNLDFGSPLYALLFENANTVINAMNNVYDIIEFWVPIKIQRNKCDVQVNQEEHSISFRLPYISNNGVIAGYFSKKFRG